MTKQNCTSINPSTQSKKRSTKQLTTAEFIKRARLIHADYNYDYSGVVYTNNRAKVFMICPEHGFFAQTAKDHLTGKGCRGCGIEKVRTSNSGGLASFLEKARTVHTCSKYNYDKVVYTNSKDKVIITCRVHGDFKQIASDHLDGHGCTKCGASKKRPRKTKRKKVVRVRKQPVYDTELFIKRATKLHKGVYSYEKSVYVDTCKTKLIITCKAHGDFSQTPNSHLRKRGCPDCGKLTGGYSRSNFKRSCDRNNNGLGYLYVIECFKGDERFYKIGRTSETISLRYSGKRMPYNYKIIHSILNNSDFVFDMERRLHGLLGNHKHEPILFFEGRTECFTTIKPIEKLLKELSTTEQLQLLA